MLFQAVIATAAFSMLSGAMAEERNKNFCLACGDNFEGGHAGFIINERTGDQWCFDAAGDYQKYDAAAPPTCFARGADNSFHEQCVCPFPKYAPSGNVVCRTCETNDGRLLFTYGILNNRWYCLEPKTRVFRDSGESGTECAVDVGYFGDPDHPLYNRKIVRALSKKQEGVACECP